MKTKINSTYSTKRPPWTPEEIKLLRKHYPKGTKAAAKYLPHRSLNSISLMARKLHIESEYNKPLQNSGNPFSKIEVEYLVENYPLLGPVPCAEFLGRTRAAVQTKAMKLGLTFIRSPEDDPWAIASPTHRRVQKWQQSIPLGPRWVFDLAMTTQPTQPLTQASMDLA